MASQIIEKNNIIKKKGTKDILRNSSPSEKRLKICNKIKKLIQKKKIKKKKNNEENVLKKKNIKKNESIEKKEVSGKKKEKRMKNKKYKNDGKINQNYINYNSKCTNIKSDILKDSLKKGKTKITTKKSILYNDEDKEKLKKKKKKKKKKISINKENISNDNNSKDESFLSFEEKFINVENEKKEKFLDIGDALHNDNDTKKEEFSEKFIDFLKNYKEEKEGSKGNKNNNEDDINNEDDYKYLSLKDDIYKVKNPKEKIDISDLIYSVDNSIKDNINNDIKYLKNSSMKHTNKHLSVIEEQNFNSSLAYIKNVETLNSFNKAYNILQNSYQVHFGCDKEENLKSEEFLNKNILKKFIETKRKNSNEKMDVDKINKEEANENNDENIDKNNDDLIYDYNFEDEMKKNLEKSKMIIVSDDILKTEKERKNEELKKIAQLKALLSLEHKKNAYKKRIKSKSYRKYLKIKERKEEEKILNKLYSEHPDVARNISNYEKEYAKKRNLINNVRKRKTVSLLNRYKNEELRKQILKSFQVDKEEKNMLKKIIERTAIKEDYDSYTYSNNGINKIVSEENASDDDNEDNTSSKYSDDNSSMDEKKKKLKNELKKRNLLRFSFVKNAEENKKNDEIYKKRKNMFNKIENNDEENNCLSDISSEKDNMEDIIELKSEIKKLNEKEINKAKEQLKKDVDFLNSLKKSNILNMSDVIQDQNTLVGENGIVESENEDNKIELDKNMVNNNSNNEESVASKLLNENLNDEMQSDEKNIKSTKGNDDVNNEAEEEINKIKNISDINAINNEEVLKRCSENITVYNFEHNIYEDYINVYDHNNNKDDCELYELSDSERIKDIKINVRKWCNYDTLLNMEKKKITEEKELIEKKKNIPLHTINVLNKKDKKFDKYYVDKIPYPYNKNEYEKTLNININKEMNDISAYRQLITPQITNKVGNVVLPLNKNPFEIANILSFKRNKKKSKL